MLRLYCLNNLSPIQCNCFQNIYLSFSGRNINFKKKQAYRTSHRRCSIKKLKISQNSISENTVPGFLFNTTAGLRPAPLIQKRDPGTGVFSWVAKYLRLPFLQNTLVAASEINQYLEESATQNLKTQEHRTVSADISFCLCGQLTKFTWQKNMLQHTE